MSKADEMFEELGFNKYETKSYIRNELVNTELYYATDWDEEDSNYREKIKINFYTKEIEPYSYSNNGVYYLNLSTELHLAIHEKMKELGWLE